MPLIPCYGCKQEVSDSVEKCPKCGFFYPLGDSISNCIECHKEIHRKSKTCYNCGIEDPLGIEKRRREEHPIYSRLEMPMFYSGGFAMAFIFSIYTEPYGKLVSYLAIVFGFFFGFLFGIILFKIFEPADYTLIPCYGCKQEISSRAETCPKCGFLYPLGDSISNCIECNKEIHTKSKTCYNCGIEDPLGIEKRRREEHPIYSRLEMPMLLGGGGLVSFVSFSYFDSHGIIVALFAAVIGFLFGFFASAMLLGMLHPSYHYDPGPDHD